MSISNLFIQKAYAAQLMAIDKDVTLTGAFDKLLTNYILPLLGGAAVLFIIYGGFLFITSGGDADKVTKARNTLLWAVLGIVLVSVSFALVSMLNSKINNLLQ